MTYIRQDRRCQSRSEKITRVKKRTKLGTWDKHDDEANILLMAAYNSHDRYKPYIFTLNNMQLMFYVFF